MRNKPNSLNDLQSAGFSYEDACALRRVAMTLHRWHELECGDSTPHASFSIVRGRKVKLLKDHIPTLRASRETFEYDDNGKPFLEVHPNYGGELAKTRYEPLPDRERGALKRLAAIMARYPGFASYVQGDPRGASLYILPPSALGFVDRQSPEFQAWLSANYSHGIAVFK